MTFSFLSGLKQVLFGLTCQVINIFKDVSKWGQEKLSILFHTSCFILRLRAEFMLYYHD